MKEGLEAKSRDYVKYPKFKTAYIFARNRFNFSARENFFILFSSFCASARLEKVFEYISFTGLRALVYFAPSFEVLCSLILRFKSVVIPVYKVLSAHLRI